MCLAVPGKVTEIIGTEGMLTGKVQFGGITREACLNYTPEVKVGDYVLVHVGFAIGTVDEEEAIRQYKVLEEMGELSELRTEEDLIPGKPESGQ